MRGIKGAFLDKTVNYLLIKISCLKFPSVLSDLTIFSYLEQAADITQVTVQMKT